MSREELHNEILNVITGFTGNDVSPEISKEIYKHLNGYVGYKVEIGRLTALTLTKDAQNNPWYDKIIDTIHHIREAQLQKSRENGKRWREKNREKARLLSRAWYYANPDKVKEYRIKYTKEHRDELNSKQREYYRLNKASVDASNKKWRQTHKRDFTLCVNRRRKEVSDELKAKGLMFTFLPITERTNKNIGYLAKKFNIPEETAKEIWETYDCNTKYILKNPTIVDKYLHRV